MTRLAMVDTENGARIGIVGDDLASIEVLDSVTTKVDDLVRGGARLDDVRGAARRAAVALDSVRLLPPLRRFNRDVLCTGWNYLDHFYESFGKREGQDPTALPEHPTFFTKGPDTVIGPFDAIRYDGAISAKWDYEAEVALVVGRDGRSIPEESALGHVFGYFLANDVSQRDLQRAHGGQWLKGKSIDETMPIGPWITTADSVDPGELPLRCVLNGETVQSASTADMAFPIERLIAELSFGMTLRAGDVVLTGTPSGIGNARDPAIFLKPGDVVEVGSDVLGTLRNPVVAAAR